MEKIIKLEGMEYDIKKYLYVVKKYDDGVYVCRKEWNRTGRKKKTE